MRTSLYSILCIVVRLGAILLIVETAVGFPLALSGTHGGPFGPGTERMLIGFSGALVALGVALWLYPGLLARPAASQAHQQVFESPISAGQLQYIAFAVLGIVFAMSALTALVGFGMRAVLTSHLHDAAFDNLRREDWARVATDVLKFVLGLALTLGSRGLVGLLQVLRESALPPALPADSADAVTTETR